jgi:hypothetical protein
LNPVETQATWYLYGFPFTVGASQSVKLSIYNNAPGGDGNDFVLDDIEIRFCAPEITIYQPSLVQLCSGANITLSGHYTNLG